MRISKTFFWKDSFEGKRIFCKIQQFEAEMHRPSRDLRSRGPCVETKEESNDESGGTGWGGRRYAEDRKWPRRRPEPHRRRAKRRPPRTSQTGNVKRISARKRTRDGLRVSRRAEKKPIFLRPTMSFPWENFSVATQGDGGGSFRL